MRRDPAFLAAPGEVSAGPQAVCPGAGEACARLYGQLCSHGSLSLVLTLTPPSLAVRCLRTSFRVTVLKHFRQCL